MHGWQSEPTDGPKGGWNKFPSYAQFSQGAFTPVWPPHEEATIAGKVTQEALETWDLQESYVNLL